MAIFKETYGEAIIHVPSGTWLNPGNTALWRKYLAWKAAGNTPDAADPIPVPLDDLIEMRDLLDASGQALNDATTLEEAKAALLDLYRALLGRHTGQKTTMQVRPRR